MSSVGMPTEPVGSLPRPPRCKRSRCRWKPGVWNLNGLRLSEDCAVRDTLHRFEATGSPVARSDGEQRRTSFAQYPLAPGDAEAGPVLAVFADGHHRIVPRLVRAPFRFGHWAADDVRAARELTELPLKQAVVSPSMLSLMVPAEGLGDYSREDFLEDIVQGCAEDIRRCFEAGAARVSIDFTEGRLALRRDLRAPWAGPDALPVFIELVNRVLDRVDAGLRPNIGVHTCPGNDRDSSHSADVDDAVHPGAPAD